MTRFAISARLAASKKTDGELARTWKTGKGQERKAAGHELQRRGYQLTTSQKRSKQ